MRHTGQSSENRSTTQNAATKKHKGGAKAEGRIASLNKFISKAAERSLPFFKVLRVKTTFQWGAEQQQAFEDLRNYLEEAVVMSKPSPKADLLLYITATDTVVSAVLVEERMEADTLKQFPIYYVSEALSSSKLFYS
jgi:hypothetical protein